MNKLSLTDLQRYILHIMYRMELFPDSKPTQTCKVIGKIISVANNYFTDSISEHCEALYALAQPWIIDMPLIECKGNIGCPEEKDYLYSGAASPFYTEVKLTVEGMGYIEKFNLQTFHLSC